LEKVTAPVPLDTLMPVPATAEVTPSLVIVTAPVPLDTLMPVPATLEVTPVFSMVEGVAPVFSVRARPDPVVVKLDETVATLGFSEEDTSTPLPATTLFTNPAEFTIISTWLGVAFVTAIDPSADPN
jgi:hypothetical protein